VTNALVGNICPQETSANSAGWFDWDWRRQVRQIGAIPKLLQFGKERDCSRVAWMANAHGVRRIKPLNASAWATSDEMPMAKVSPRVNVRELAVKIKCVRYGKRYQLAAVILVARRNVRNPSDLGKDNGNVFRNSVVEWRMKFFLLMRKKKL
jgi:hypothetical protein